MEEKLPKRKPTRLQNHDYSAASGYFITICTEGRRRILSTVVGADVLDGPPGARTYVTRLSEKGRIAERILRQLDAYYESISVDAYVIMPNHIHLILFIPYDGGASRTSPPTRQHAVVCRFVSTFKRFCNKEYGKNVWQRSFYDHIIRSREDYDEAVKYICANPTNWHFDELYTE